MAILNCFQKGTSYLQLRPSVYNSCPYSVLVLYWCHPGSTLKSKHICSTFNFCTQMTYLHCIFAQEISFIFYIDVKKKKKKRVNSNNNNKPQQLCLSHKAFVHSISSWSQDHIQTFQVNHFRQIKNKSRIHSLD